MQTLLPCRCEEAAFSKRCTSGPERRVSLCRSGPERCRTSFTDLSLAEGIESITRQGQTQQGQQVSSSSGDLVGRGQSTCSLKLQGPPDRGRPCRDGREGAWGGPCLGCRSRMLGPLPGAGSSGLRLVPCPPGHISQDRSVCAQPGKGPGRVGGTMHEGEAAGRDPKEHPGHGMASGVNRQKKSQHAGGSTAEGWVTG